MRSFSDADGEGWVAEVRERPGADFKGRFGFVARRARGGAEGEVALEDVRWNSERAARRTLESMSEVELRRRLRSALGRARRSASTI